MAAKGGSFFVIGIQWSRIFCNKTDRHENRAKT